MIYYCRLILPVVLVLVGFYLIVTMLNPFGIVAVIVGERMISKVFKNNRFFR